MQRMRQHGQDGGRQDVPGMQRQRQQQHARPREMTRQLRGHDLRLVDGAPDITRLPCDRLIAAGGTEYMRRYYTRTPAGQQARFHRILASDPGRDYHDHPWDFISHLLAGTYTEHTPDGTTVYTAPCTIVRKAEQLHRLELPEGPVWSYVILGRVRRKWGFMTQGGWVHWSRYGDAGRTAGCSPPQYARW